MVKRIDLEAFLGDGLDATNVVLQAGDRLIVQESDPDALALAPHATRIPCEPREAMLYREIDRLTGRLNRLEASTRDGLDRLANPGR